MGKRTYEVIQAFGDDPHASQRKVAQQCRVSLSLGNRISKDDGLRPWKVKWVQENCTNMITLPEKSSVRPFEPFEPKKDEDNRVIRKTCFSDEAIFHVKGSVNKHKTAQPLHLRLHQSSCN